MGMIIAVSLRLVYLIFDRLLHWLLLLGRTSSSKTSSCSSYATRSPYSAEPTPKPRLDWADRAVLAALIRHLPATVHTAHDLPVRPQQVAGMIR